MYVGEIEITKYINRECFIHLCENRLMFQREKYRFVFSSYLVNYLHMYSERVYLFMRQRLSKK